MENANVAQITIAHMRSGEPNITKGGFIYFTCCDCGLVHLIRIETAEQAKGESVITAYRDDFLTEEVRKELERPILSVNGGKVLPTPKRKGH